MPIGKLKTLVHLSQQRHLPNTRLVPDHNDKGYGFIEDAQGREVYFSHEVVKNRFGFDDLRKGQCSNTRWTRLLTCELASVWVDTSNPAGDPRAAA